jgi:hypothetical protein
MPAKVPLDDLSVAGAVRLDSGLVPLIDPATGFHTGARLESLAGLTWKTAYFPAATANDIDNGDTWTLDATLRGKVVCMGFIGATAGVSITSYVPATGVITFASGGNQGGWMLLGCRG